MQFTLSAILETVPAWLSFGAGGGAGFFLIKFLFDWIGVRVDKREAVLGAEALRLDAGVQRFIKHLQDELDNVMKRLDIVEEELIDCRRRHSASEAEAMRLKAMLQGMGDARDEIQTGRAAKSIVERGEKQ